MADTEGTIHLERYTPDARQIVANAQQLADDRQHAEVSPLHLLARLLERPGVAEVFRRAKAEPNEVMTLAEASLRKQPKASGGVAYVDARLIDLLSRAEREATRDKSPTVGLEHLLHALAQEIRGPAGEILSSFGVGPGAFRPHLAALTEVAKEAPQVAASSSSASAGGGGDGASGGYTRDLVGDARKGRFDPVIGRDAEARRLLQILERRFKNHPLIVGEPGVGKTALIRGLADRIARGDVPSNLAGARLVELDTGALVAGAKLRGEIEQRLKGLVDKLRSVQDAETILVVEDIDSLFGQGVQGAGVGDLLKPLLARSEIRILATTTPEGVRKMNERDAAVLRRFSVVTIEAPSIEQATEVLRGVAAKYEAHHRVRIGESAIASAVTLARRYVSDRALPDTAVDLLDESAARKRVEVDGVPAEVDALSRRVDALKAQISALADDDDKLSVQVRQRLERELAEVEPKAQALRTQVAARRGVVAAVQSIRKELTVANEALAAAQRDKNFAKIGELEHVTLPEIRRRLEAAEQAAQREGASPSSNMVTENDVATTLADWTGIPVAKMLEGEAEKLLKMEERLARRVVGQDEAVRAIARAVRRGRVGLRDPGKPIGSFMFLGPSGVGKTELAKALAEFLFDDEQALTRLDMSEFMERHMAQRLIGAPPGYADSEQGGFLTEAARRRPYSVLLFDEVEKAHADVFNLLLQILDDGRLTDGRGRTADFSNTVVIMTSNIGSKRILESDPKLWSTEDGREAIRDVLFDELKSFFRPEFLNRIDDIVVFKALSKADLRGIVDIQLRRLERLLADREIKVNLDDAAKDLLVELGYEPTLGARPLKRAILKELQNPLAEAILAGGFSPGQVVQVRADGTTFVFSKP
ncbi:ATP-dependent Clp protease ATP-binding subunit [Polyangium aurulentum]|uniref:ATP-dependent Clp protease ATP-binding subunit n=1 Tax=Polyangium aurulentum TaxID=2567896 RepID=UPI0010AE948F|nr:AAA family ATPase [Polyangium aurulentum]UQA61565.1 ATP-dependent Clp protease ATP-binding subunit [Polyangium aurulentum]